jgi:hypothetical protein
LPHPIVKTILPRKAADYSVPGESIVLRLRVRSPIFPTQNIKKKCGSPIPSVIFQLGT